MPKIPSSLTPTEQLTSTDELPSQLGDAHVVSTTGARTPDLVSLYDHKNGNVLAVPHDEAEAYLKSGQFALPKKTRINVVGPDGEPASIDGAEAYNALQSGYRLETQAETQERRLQEQYGSGAQQAVAGLAGAARGASFGLSDQALVQSGAVAPETLRGLEEANPASSLTGEAVGILGPALLSGGESLVPKILGSGAEAASAAGKTAERLLTKQALKAGLSNSVAKSIVTKIAPAIAGSAVEGAFYGAGQLLSEDALGKADLNAENLAAYIGTGALLNGAFGAAFAGAAELAGPLSQAAKFISTPFTQKISKESQADVAAARLFGLTPNELTKQMEKRPGVIRGMKEYLADDLKLGMLDTPEALATKNQVVRETAGREIEGALNQMDAAFEFRSDLKPKRTEVWSNISEKVRTEFGDWLETNSGPGTGKVRRQVESFLKDVDKLAAEAGTFGAKDLQKLKRVQDAMMNYEKTPGKWTVFEDLAHATRSGLKEEIDKAADRLFEEGTRRDLATELREANRKYAASSTFGDFLDKRAAKAADKTLTLIGTVKDVGLDLSRKLVVLGKIEQGRQMAARAIKQTVRAFETGTKGLSKTAQIAVPSIANSALALNYEQGKPVKPKSQSQAYNNVLNNLNSFTASPTAFMEKSNRQTASLYGAAPQTSAQLDNLAMTAMTYLSMKVPKRTANTTLLSPYQPVPLPSTQDLAKFARTMHAIEKPMDVLKGLQAGTASREEMEVLKEIYPATFKELQDTFIAELPKLHKTMPYNRRVQLGLLMGVPADASMLPQNVLGLQMLFGQTQQAEQGAVKPTASGMENMSADHVLTPLQETQAGLSE